MVWLPGFWEQWRVGQTLRASLPGWAEVVSVPFLKAVPLTLAKFVTGVLEVDISLWFVVSVGLWWVLLGVGVLAALASLQKKPGLSRNFLLQTLFLTSIAFGAAWLFTLLTPVLAPKRVLYLLPLILALVGVVVQYRRWVGLALVSWFVAWQAWANWSYWTQPVLQRENWRALVQEVEHSFSAQNTAVVFGFDGPFASWRWYATEGWQTYNTGTVPPASYAEVEETLMGVQNYEYVLVFDYLRDLTDPDRKIEFVLSEWGYEEIGAITYPNIGPVRMWVRQQLFAENSQYE
ncbi:hypothetical protein LRY65_04635 [Candidatus Woesebacteria bacterium]|nr:hypothetical protein [Candidatus Woesebacteria bacterium]MCD8527459.1 hypothetical protein [Candidatus Woesebacteria bacterium]